MKASEHLHPHPYTVTQPTDTHIHTHTHCHTTYTPTHPYKQFLKNTKNTVTQHTDSPPPPLPQPGKKEDKRCSSIRRKKIATKGLPIQEININMSHTRTHTHTCIYIQTPIHWSCPLPDFQEVQQVVTDAGLPLVHLPHQLQQRLRPWVLLRHLAQTPAVSDRGVRSQATYWQCRLRVQFYRETQPLSSSCRAVALDRELSTLQCHLQWQSVATTDSFLFQNHSQGAPVTISKLSLSTAVST